MKKVIIEWSNKKLINDIIDELGKEKGLYYISRLYNGKERSLYIGKSADDIKHRLKSHSKSWLYLYPKSKIYVRIGKIIYPKTVDASMIDDIESGLIFEHGMDMYGTKVLIENTGKVNSYSYKNLYYIENIGDKFELKYIVDMNNQED